MSKEKEKVYHCSRCGVEIRSEDVTVFDGEELCPSCLERETVLCEHCGDRIWRDDNAGNSYITLCQDCYDNHYTNCERCGCIILEDYANYVDDDPYCDDCYDRLKGDHPIHDYSYKPDPIFYGSGKRFFGVELEIDEGGKDNDNAEALLDIANLYDEKIYIKCDGSLDDGMEIVTHPMTLDYHKNQMPWQDIMYEAIVLGYKSHKSGTCGLHVHVNRETFGEIREAQEDAISRVLYFVEHHWNELLKFSRRTEAQMSQWAARYDFVNIT